MTNYSVIHKLCKCKHVKLRLRVHCGPVLVPSPGKGGGLVAGCRYRHP